MVALLCSQCDNCYFKIFIFRSTASIKFYRKLLEIQLAMAADVEVGNLLVGNYNGIWRVSLVSSRNRLTVSRRS